MVFFSSWFISILVLHSKHSNICSFHTIWEDAFLSRTAKQFLIFLLQKNEKKTSLHCIKIAWNYWRFLLIVYAIFKSCWNKLKHVVATGIWPEFSTLDWISSRQFQLMNQWPYYKFESYQRLNILWRSKSLTQFIAEKTMWILISHSEWRYRKMK